uniref:U3 small nucleolar RNA-associated protein 6 homolog n=1 Tax=Phallusia mammillata TaxID=59560 RepID=A0A6F9DX46_9ASCI|nr:U3 small nucleolar RNA-associated protein 6 homolog [Phallusia mammillata]
MAENVHHWTEQMLPELEQMQRVNLFSNKEVKAIIKKRTTHEYKLVRRTKDKKDFLSYIQYEVSLLDLIHKRRKRENYYFKKDEIEFAIVARIHRLFKQATFRWASDLKLWLSHAQFCIKWKKKVQLSKLCTKLLQVHGNKPKIWVLAAKWQLECGDSVEDSRSLFLQALKNFPMSQYVWLEYFRAELLYLEKIRNRLNVLSGERGEKYDNHLGPSEAIFLNGGAAKIVYKNAIKSIPDDVDFHIRMLDIASLFLSKTSCVAKIITEIVEDLKENYSEKAKVYAAIAKLHLQPAIDFNSPDGLNMLVKQEKLCCKEFEKAVERLNSTEMWGEYFDFLHALHIKEPPTTSNGWKSVCQQRKTMFFKVAHRAHELEKLSPDRYIVFVEHLVQNGTLNEAYTIIESAFKRLNNIALLLKFTALSLLVSESELEKINKHELLQQFIECSSNMDCLKKLGALWLQHAISANDLVMAKHILQHIIKKCGKDDTIDCQELYWKWISGSMGINQLYKVFIESIPPLQKPTLKQYRSVLNVVNCLDAPQVATKFYERAIDDYGKDDPSLWIEYIKLKHSLGGMEAVKIGKIYWRAMKTLTPMLTESFVANYTLLNL